MRAMIMVLVFAAIASVTYGQTQPTAPGVESRLEQLERKTDSTGGAILFLFGAFCALWAQNSGRNAWLWFFLGLFFNVLTVVVLLVKNAGDRKRLQASRSAA